MNTEVAGGTKKMPYEIIFLNLSHVRKHLCYTTLRKHLTSLEAFILV